MIRARRFVATALACALALGLGACGQKGPLRLPDPPKTAAMAP